jgi:hypothetical protein
MRKFAVGATLLVTVVVVALSGVPRDNPSWPIFVLASKGSAD